MERALHRAVRAVREEAVARSRGSSPGLLRPLPAPAARLASCGRLPAMRHADPDGGGRLPRMSLHGKSAPRVQDRDAVRGRRDPLDSGLQASSRPLRPSGRAGSGRRRALLAARAPRRGGMRRPARSHSPHADPSAAAAIPRLQPGGLDRPPGRRPARPALCVRSARSLAGYAAPGLPARRGPATKRARRLRCRKSTPWRSPNRAGGRRSDDGQHPGSRGGSAPRSRCPRGRRTDPRGDAAARSQKSAASGAEPARCV